MARRVGRLRVDDVGEGLADAVDSAIVEHEDAIGGLELAHERRHVVAREIAPEAVGGTDRQQNVGELGVEPAPTALAHHLLGGRQAVRREEHLGRLAEAGDARGQRDRVAGQAERLAATVPVLVERAHRIGRRGREAQARDDRGAAVAARLDDRLALGHERAQHRERALRACDAPAAGHVPRGVARDCGRLRPVDQLAVRLERDVVGAEQLAHASGRRRAAHVLEQQRVIEGVPAPPRRAATRAPGACRSDSCARPGRRDAPRSCRARARARR